MTDSKHALVAFGANLSIGERSPEAAIRQAIDCLTKSHHLEVVSVSRMFKTPCFPKGAGPDYVNAAGLVCVPASVTADEVLHRLHAVEALFGRTRETRWGMRTLDIDLLAIEDLVLPDKDIHRQWMCLAPADQASLAPDQLILPHPRMQDRAFVLVPLAEVAPDWVHPVLRQTVLQMRDALPPEDCAQVMPMV